MEMLVRNANDKYIKSKVCGSWSEAIDKITQDLLPYMLACDYQEWRETTYWTEGCDMIFHKKYGFHLHKIVKQIFKDIKGEKVLPGEHHYICNKEFIDLTKEAGLHNNHFGEQKAQLAFCLAQVDN